MHAILMTTLPRFLLEHKNSSHFFEICLPPEDSPWMKQAVVVGQAENSDRGNNISAILNIKINRYTKAHATFVIYLGA